MSGDDRKASACVQGLKPVLNRNYMNVNCVSSPLSKRRKTKDNQRHVTFREQVVGVDNLFTRTVECLNDHDAGLDGDVGGACAAGSETATSQEGPQECCGSDRQTGGVDNVQHSVSTV